ncbi:MAG: hypothetical protein L0Z50_19785, partial [Verrucomicrobiales bacterium]|nr:hypothetical protein [Verrucomicrobiales bacterium]
AAQTKEADSSVAKSLPRTVDAEVSKVGTDPVAFLHDPFAFLQTQALKTFTAMNPEHLPGFQRPVFHNSSSPCC